MIRGIKQRRVFDKAFKSLTLIIAFSAVLPLIMILWWVFSRGLAALGPEFLTSLPPSPGESGGGIIHAITGTFIILLISCAVSIPVGIMAGIYLAEKKNKISSALSLSIEILQGVPSIVLGLVGYTWFVLSTGGFSAFAGGFTLSIMMLPSIIKSTEETLKMIPDPIREASYALGVPYHRTILKVILPSGLSGVVTGVLLSIARVAGETAPLLFTAFGNPFLNLNPSKPMEAMPLLIYNFATGPYEGWHRLAWGASFFLVALVLILNIGVRILVKKWKIQF